MPKTKNRKKFYMIKSGERNFGAFPLTKEGKEKAEKYIKLLKKTSKAKFIIKRG